MWRNQITYLYGYKSKTTCMPVIFGVPQWSAFGPTLFSLFSNNLLEIADI